MRERDTCATATRIGESSLLSAYSVPHVLTFRVVSGESRIPLLVLDPLLDKRRHLLQKDKAKEGVISCRRTRLFCPGRFAVLIKSSQVKSSHLLQSA